MEKPFKKVRSLDVMGTKIRVRYSKHLECEEGEPMDGFFNYQSQTIFINTSRPNLKATLLHELAHAVLYLSGAHNLLSTQVEETVVSAIENGLKDYFTY